VVFLRAQQVNKPSQDAGLTNWICSLLST